MTRYIRGMSIERNRAIQQLDSFSPIIMEHIIKLLVYSDIRPDDVEGWIGSVANWIHRADDVTVKPSAKKLKESDIVSSLFGCMGDDVRDYQRALYAFLADTRTGKLNHDGKESYPEFDVTGDLSQDLMDVCYDVIDATMPLLLDKQDHTINEYIQVISPIFDKLV